MATNCTGARFVQHPIQLAYEAFDRLPRGLRDRLNRSTLALDPVQAWNTFLAVARAVGPHAAEKFVIDAIGKTEDAGLRRLGSDYEARHGTTLPHIAARATILR